MTFSVIVMPFFKNMLATFDALSGQRIRLKAL